MSIADPTEEERVALCEWLTANGIDFCAVPLRDSGLRIEEQQGVRTICWTAFVLTSDGRHQIDLEDPDKKTLTQEASAPCTVEPPAWLGVPGARAD